MGYGVPRKRVQTRCKGRVRYTTQALADYACNEYDKRSREAWRGVVGCDDCQGWHLGPSQKDRVAANDVKRDRHEAQCAGVRLNQKRSGKDGVMWFQCSGCQFTFNELTEGAANLVRRSGSIPVTV